MNRMLNVGIIGAGSISTNHLSAYSQNPNVKIVAIADLNEILAKKKAEDFGISYYTKDYKELLADSNIDAVSIVTPTFTHCKIVIEALESGKHVLCEKPPALNAQETMLCAEAAKKSGKLLMYGLVCRFKKEMRFLKDCVDRGELGKILYAEASRVGRCSQLKGWFNDKNKSGGGLLDANIHEIDACLYLMGFPKPVSVLGFTSNVNSDLPNKISGLAKDYQSSDTNTYNRSVESIASGMVTFENGACLHIKCGSIMNSVNTGAFVDICAEKAGARINQFSPDFKMVELKNEKYFVESQPVLAQKENNFELEINHYVDCCLNGTKCINTPEQAVMLMKIMDALYESAESGKAIMFD